MLTMTDQMLESKAIRNPSKIAYKKLCGGLVSGKTMGEDKNPSATPKDFRKNLRKVH